MLGKLTTVSGLAIIAGAFCSPVNAQPQAYDFDIPAQDLRSALRTFVEKTRVQAIFDGDAMRGKRSQPLKGQYLAEAAMANILDGSGMTARKNAEGVVIISRAATPAMSPATPPPASSPIGDPGEASGNDILVTAQRREQSAQDVPISISVATGEMLRQENIHSLEDLGERSAGVKIAQGGASDQLHVRGTGSSFNAGFEQSVATFVDGIYHSRSRSIRIAFFDVERIEVLKGPQTTFFGANAIAGAINITTKGPADIFEGNASALYSPSDGEYNLEGGLSIPIGDDLAVRVAGRFSGMDGYIHADHQNTDGPDLDDKQGRISIHWNPADRLDIKARYDIARLRDKGVLISELLNCSPTSPPLGLCARSRAILGDFDDDLDRHSASTVPTKSDVDLDEAALTATFDFDAASLVSTTGYLRQESATLFDLTPYPTLSPIGLPTYFVTNNGEHFKQFSQELRLQSDTDGPLSYMIGGYYEHAKLSFNALVGFYLAPFGAAAAPVYSANTPVAARSILNQTSETWSGFGSVSYELTDALTLSAGLRYSSVKKIGERIIQMGTADAFVSTDSFVPAPQAVQPILAAATGSSLSPFAIPRRTDDKFMPSASLRYEIASDSMIYLSYARGFKAGGYSTTTPDSFAPEVVDNYELGIKARWLDRRLTTNLTLFRSDFSDLQETANIFTVGGVIQSVVTNAAKSRSSGVELSSSLRLGDLVVRSELAYLDAHYVKYPNAPCTPLQTTNSAACFRDLSGRRRAFAPKWSGSVGADYRIGIGVENSLRFGGTVYFSSAYYRQPTIGPLVEQEGYAKLDMRIAIGPDNRRWELAVIGKNITDKTTASFGNYLPGAASSSVAVADRPRSVAIQASVKW